MSTIRRSFTDGCFSHGPIIQLVNYYLWLTNELPFVSHPISSLIGPHNEENDLDVVHTTMATSFYYALRLAIHKNRRLLRLAQILRAFVLIGPLRPLLLRYHLARSTTSPLIRDASPLLNDLDSDQALRDLTRNGYAPLGLISESCIAKILQYCQKHNRIQYWNPHHECDAIAQIARNEKIVDIVHRYFGAEPILWLTQVKWSLGPNGVRLQPPSYRVPTRYDNYSFHYDTNDIKSVTVFVYLTEVCKDCTPHTVIQGTHKSKSLKEVTRIVLDDESAEATYGARIKTIVGASGTAFIEDTLAYHKISAGTKNRCMLSIDYVLRRKVPPARPAAE